MSLVLKTANILAVAAGQHTTVAASDTVATGLREVHFAIATLSSDPIAANAFASVAVPDQVSSPGNITIKTWKPNGAGDSAPVAASTHSKLVSWVAFGL